PPRAGGTGGVRGKLTLLRTARCPGLPCENGSDPCPIEPGSGSGSARGPETPIACTREETRECRRLSALLSWLPPRLGCRSSGGLNPRVVPPVRWHPSRLDRAGDPRRREARQLPTIRPGPRTDLPGFRPVGCDSPREKPREGPARLRHHRSPAPETDDQS